MKERDFHGRERTNNAVKCTDHKENHWEVAISALLHMGEICMGWAE